MEQPIFLIQRINPIKLQMLQYTYIKVYKIFWPPESKLVKFHLSLLALIFIYSFLYYFAQEAAILKQILLVSFKQEKQIDGSF